MIKEIAIMILLRKRKGLNLLLGKFINTNSNTIVGQKEEQKLLKITMITTKIRLRRREGKDIIRRK